MDDHKWISAATYTAGDLPEEVLRDLNRAGLVRERWADYFWGRLQEAYRDADTSGQAYRVYRDAVDQWNRFCACEDAARAARR